MYAHCKQINHRTLLEVPHSSSTSIQLYNCEIALQLPKSMNGREPRKAARMDSCGRGSSFSTSPWPSRSWGSQKTPWSWLHRARPRQRQRPPAAGRSPRSPAQGMLRTAALKFRFGMYWPLNIYCETCFPLTRNYTTSRFGSATACHISSNPQ